MGASDRWLVIFLISWVLETAAFFLVGQPFWGWLWLGILTLVGVIEVISKVKTGQTISTNFRRWAQTHVWQAILLLIGMPLSMIFLVAHLSVR